MNWPGQNNYESQAELKEKIIALQSKLDEANREIERLQAKKEWQSGIPFKDGWYFFRQLLTPEANPVACMTMFSQGKFFYQGKTGLNFEPERDRWYGPLEYPVIAKAALEVK